MTRVVVDANIMVGALLGRSLPLFIGLLERDVEVLAPIPMLIEAEERIGRDERLIEGEAARRLGELLEVVTPVRVEEFAEHEEAARERLEAHAQSDWPLLAAALALDADIWTKDRDLFGTGVAVWATRNIRFVEREAL
ncbi:MAG TPA: PIN domain-containing protein [Allosphingosinicella sp.]|jgi:predicted nucleic acid-binding protein|nr:PIN domain-containing protein [Allosphingosinicella sp.]